MSVFVFPNEFDITFRLPMLVVSEVVLGNKWNSTQSRNDLDIHKVRARNKLSMACERTHEFAA